jgi:hypothetical protein
MKGAVSFRCAPPYETVILNGVCVEALRGMKDPVEVSTFCLRECVIALHVATTGFFAPAKAAHKGWLRMTVLMKGAVSFRCAPPYETVILNGANSDVSGILVLLPYRANGRTN